MIRATVNEIVPVTATLIDEYTGQMVSGETVFYEVLNVNDAPLVPPVDGIMSESSAHAGIYKTEITVASAGNYIIYATCAGYTSTADTLIVSANTVEESVWDALVSKHTLTGSFGEAVYNTAIDVSFIKDVEGGRWVIENNQMIFFKSDNVTEIMRFDLYDLNGAPANEHIYDRKRNPPV